MTKPKTTTTTTPKVAAAAANFRPAITETAVATTTNIAKSESSATTTAGGVVHYLQTSLPRRQLLELYAEETRGRFVCRAVLQQLSSVAQQIVLRLSCTGGTFPLSGVQVWVALHDKHKAKIIHELYLWAIVVAEPTATTSTGAPTAAGANDKGIEAAITLTNEFLQGLMASLTCLDTSPWRPLTSDQIVSLEREHGEQRHVDVTPEDLERYTQTQWDSVLHFLVGTIGQQEPPGAVVHFLMQTGLMQPDADYVGDEEDAPLVITQRGYDFMLQDNHMQVWHFCSQYLRSLESHKKGAELRREALLLLICLSFARVGEAYLANALSKDARVIVKDLSLFGLLYTRKVGAKCTLFYPTRVAVKLVGGHDLADGGGQRHSTSWSLSSKALEAALAHPRPHDSSHLAIIVQTNFQVCAYTTSELHVSMLGLFCDVQTIRRLPNMVFMVITRDSIKSAFALGIQTRQILRFLEKHAHPKLRTNNSSPVPSNVMDQILLWDRERTRVRFNEVFQHLCIMAGEFRAVQQYALDRDAHVWSSERQQLIFIDYSRAEKVQNFIRQWRSKSARRSETD